MLFEPFQIENFAGSETGADGFGGIRRTDAAEGRADLFAFGGLGFVVGVEQFVPRHDELAAVAELNVCNADPALLESLHFLHQGERIDDDSVADDVDDFASENSGRNQMENVFFGTVFDGMARVVSALKSDDHIGVASEYIDDFTFTLVTPLDADEHVYGHSFHSNPIRCFPVLCSVIQNDTTQSSYNKPFS